MSTLRGIVGFKGERGYSAYEIAVQNGYVGTEQDWLATLGTSTHLEQGVTSITATDGQTVFPLPDLYVENDSFLDVYVDGHRIESAKVTIDTSSRIVTLTDPVTEGSVVEMVVISYTTNDLPIVQTIDENSSDGTVAGTLSIYNFVTGLTNNLNSEITNLTTNLTDNYLTAVVEEEIEEAEDDNS